VARPWHPRKGKGGFFPGEKENEAHHADKGTVFQGKAQQERKEKMWNQGKST